MTPIAGPSTVGTPTVEVVVEIDAPLDTVWQIVLDTDAYSEWNPFVVRADTAQPPAVGNRILLEAVWANGSRTRSPERISEIVVPHDTPGGNRAARLDYVYEGLPARLGLVRGTRVQELSGRPGAPTRYRTAEYFAGPLVRFAGPGRVADGFRRHAEALARHAESIARG